MNVADRLNQREIAAYTALMEAGSLLQQRVDRQLRRDGSISQPQFEILAHAALTPGGMRMSDLADRAVLSRSGVSYRVAQLEALGLLVRSGSAADERSVIATATPAGEALIARLLPAHVALVRESLLSVLSEDDLNALGDILARVAAHLRGAGTTGRSRTKAPA